VIHCCCGVTSAVPCRFWMSEVAYLPWGCRSLATACLQAHPKPPPTAAELLDCDFFPQPVRTAASFLAALHPFKHPLRQICDMSHDQTPDQTMSLADSSPWLLGESSVYVTQLLRHYVLKESMTFANMFDTVQLACPSCGCTAHCCKLSCATVSS